MARKPSGQYKRNGMKIYVLLLCGIVLPGCEVGNTMFQYSSGGSPWMGINLIPKRKTTSATTIRHEQEFEKNSPRKGSVTLVQQEENLMKNYEKKPLRLDLPSSRTELQPTKLTATPEDNFSVTAFADTHF